MRRQQWKRRGWKNLKAGRVLELGVPRKPILTRRKFLKILSLFESFFSRNQGDQSFMYRGGVF